MADFSGSFSTLRGLPEKLANIIGLHGKQVISVDVFDTLVWRPFYAPADAFAELHSRLTKASLLGGQLSRTEFAAVRIECEAQARREKAGSGLLPEVDIVDIYNAMPATLIARADLHAAIACEIAVESDFMILDRVLWQTLATLKSRGCVIVIISDFYAGIEQLKQILAGAGATEIGSVVDHFFISCIAGSDKANGSFAFAMSALDLRPDQILHLGDNAHADIASAQALGIATLHMPRFEASYDHIFAAEQQLRRLVNQSEFLDSDNGLHGLRQRICSAAQAQFGGGRDPFFELGVLSFGPMLAGYTEWLTRNMVQRGLRVGLCVTREGIYLSELLSRVAAHSGAEIAYAPLLSNRKTLYSASFFEGSLKELEQYVFSARTPLTLRELATALDLSPGVLRIVPHELIDFPLRANIERAHEILGLLAADPRIKPFLVTCSRAWRTRLVAHVRHQLALAGITEIPALSQPPLRVAFIDVGWSGTSQGQLQRILHSLDLNIVFEGLYLATDKPAVRAIQKGAIISPWLVASGEGGLLGSLIANCKEIIEEACTNDVGAVIDYDLNGAAIHKAEKLMTVVQRSQQASLRSGIELFLGEYFCRWRSLPYFRAHPLADALHAIRTVVARVVAYPTNDESEGLARWLHEEGGHFGRVEAVVNRHHDTLVEYGTLRQAQADMGYYWLVSALHERRPALTSRLIFATVGYFPHDDRHVAELGAHFAFTMSFAEPHKHEQEVFAPAYLEMDGRGLSYRVFFATEPLSLTWIGSRPFEYTIDRIEVHCRYTDLERELVVHTMPVPQKRETSHSPVLPYSGDRLEIVAPCLHQRRPREIAAYVCVRRSL